MKMGVDGIHLLKPEDAETQPGIEDVDSGGQYPTDVEVYDEVYEEDTKNTTVGSESKPKNVTKFD